MEFEWNEAKRQSNLAKHGLDFADVAQMNWNLAAVEGDARFEYGEDRFIAVGEIDGRVVAVAYTVRGNILRIVSFRPASRRDRARYDA